MLCTLSAVAYGQQVNKVSTLPTTQTEQSEQAKQAEQAPEPTVVELKEKLDLANSKVNYLSAVLIRMIDRIEALEEHIKRLEKVMRDDEESRVYPY